MSISLAIREASRARHKQHRLGAVLLKGGKPVASAHNFDRTHAEVAAMDRVWKSELQGLTILVVRARKGGGLGMAKPCPDCMEKLVAAGIKKVVYSDDDGNLVTVRI